MCIPRDEDGPPTRAEGAARHVGADTVGMQNPSGLTALGVRLAWVDGALRWGQAAQKLVAAGGFSDVQLGFVALYLCVARADLLLSGYEDRFTGFAVQPDETAAGDAPIDAPRLRQLTRRVEMIRDQIVHLHDGLEPGRLVTLSHTPGVVTIAIVGKGGRRVSMTDREVAGILEALLPWLGHHRERLIAERETGSAPWRDHDQEAASQS